MTSGLAPIVRVCAPPGTGKTTVLPELLARADGWVVVDIDEVLTDGRLLGVLVADPSAAPIWPQYGQLWDTITGFARRAGHPVLMLGPVPSPADPWSADPIVGWAVPDELRESRLGARGWADEAIADAQTDADALAAMVDERLVVSPAGETPAQSADRLWMAARSLLEA